MYCIDCNYDYEKGMYFCTVFHSYQYLTVYSAKTYEECRSIAENTYGRENVCIIFGDVIPA